MIRARLLTILISSMIVLCRPTWNVGALYTLTNDPRGSSIVINAIKADGTISYSGSVLTGGTGIHGTNGVVPGPDALFSQNPIQVSGNHIFLVNPGSNSVSMFRINPVNPLQIEMVGKPVSSGGEFPVSLSVSPDQGNVCVLNGGKVNGLSCFAIDPVYGMKPHQQSYSFHLNQTTPANGPAGAVSQVLYSSNGKKVRVSVKGIPGATATDPPVQEGFLASWDVEWDGSLSSTYEKIVPGSGDGLLPFGMTNVAGAEDAVIVTDPALGVTIYDFSSSSSTGAGVKFTPLTIEGQKATCWIEYSKATGTYWATDLGSNRIYQVGVSNGKTGLGSKLESVFSLSAGYNATDIVVGTIANNQYLYALSPLVSTFNVYALKSGNTKLVQQYDFGQGLEQHGVENTPANLVGAAVYIL